MEQPALPQAIQQQPTSLKKKQLKITFFEWFFIISILLLVLSFSFNWMMGGLVHHRAEIQIPDLKGTSLSYAVDRLSALNISLMKEEEEFDQSLPEGAVIRQAPLPGTLVREGKTVRVVLSKGGQKVFVPVVVSKPLRIAEIDFRQSSLSLGEVTERYSLSIPKGNVIQQDPEPRSIVERNSMIHLIVSSGEPPADIDLMPDFIGKTITAAQQWAHTQKIDIKSIVNDPLSAVVKGEIISQNPSPDTILDNETQVNFTVGISTTIAKANRVFAYALPQGAGKKAVMMKLIDGANEHLLYKESKLPGTKLEIPYEYCSGARIQVYIDNILVEERKLP